MTEQVITVFQSPRKHGKLNFGDLISKDIIRKITGAKVITTDVKQFATVSAVGSILPTAAPFGNLKVVWGSGFIRDGGKVDFQDVNIAAVRGKLTAKRIGFKGALGDPGLLVPLYFKKSDVKTDKIGVIPHYIDKNNDFFKELLQDERFFLIDVEREPEEVIKDISSAKAIISSSLHGLIISDSFNIPNFWVEVSDKVIGSGYKFEDYFSGVGRKSKMVKIVNYNDITYDYIIEKAKKWRPIRNLDNIQQNLVNAFPKTIDSRLSSEKDSLYTDLNLKEYPSGSTVERILIYTGKQNIIEIAKENSDIRRYYYDLLRRGFVMNYYKDGFSYLVKRENVKIQGGFEWYNERLPYTLVPVLEKRKNNSDHKLLVIFSGFSGRFGQSSAFKRGFSNYFPDIERYLVKNVAVLRLVDLNLTYGSSYLNTENYPEYEDDVQKLIKHVAEKQGVEKNNIVLYGPSKGGTGALYHGSLGDFKTVAVDPIVNFYEYNNDRDDVLMMKGAFPEDLVPMINENSKHNSSRQVVIDNQFVEYNYDQHARLHNGIDIVNLNDETVQSHPDVAKNSVPELFYHLNDMWLSVD
ncbi:XcbB/CpsF family capsular polysaccharide biosynthesis protein [Weissella sp. GP1]|uniref:XcbB/CpsF family capsular polysaccharide biosynthesis protein n=1 Tax=Weissella confusa TaxID=1583 RepID=UPI0032DA12BA